MLETDLRKLSRESLKDMLLLAGRPFDLEKARLLVHSAILYANSVGAPGGSTLSSVSEAVPGIYDTLILFSCLCAIVLRCQNVFAARCFWILKRKFNCIKMQVSIERLWLCFGIRLEHSDLSGIIVTSNQG